MNKSIPVRSAVCGIICALRAVERCWQSQKQQHPAETFDCINTEDKNELETAFVGVMEKYNCVASLLGKNFVNTFDGK
jgi:hypothetical protein